MTGDTVGKLRLTAMDGEVFDLDALKGKRFMLSFFRFAACPFCNLRLHELVRRFDEFGDGFTIVAIFDSPLDNLAHYAGRHRPPFPVLADPHNIYYREYAIERSIVGMLKGALLRLPQAMYGVFAKAYVPLSIQGRLTTLPADFLVDETGVIRRAYYGSDVGDHLPFERVEEFSRGWDA
ncbi:MAG: AhpC/TSA family protein [Gammaproteobacteria bacterium]|nr:AhpC/TSA family protein [Gammaproteobacteria bacterium]